MGMDIGSAVGGLAQGFGQGVDIAAKIAALRDGRRMADARRAVGQSYMGGGRGPMPQPPMPGQASAPPGMDPGLMALPSGGAPPPPAPPPLPPEIADAFSPQPPPMPAGPIPAPAAAGPAPGGDGSLSNPVKDAQSTITNIAAQIEAANPGIAPEALFDATQLQIEQMKGVRNDVRDYMMAQVELAKAQTKVQTTEMVVAGRKDVAGIQADARIGAAEIGADSRERVAETGAGARVRAAEIGGDSRRDVAATGAGARVEAARIGADSRENVAETAAGARTYSADQGYRSRVDSAGVMMGSRRPLSKPVPKPKAARSTTNTRGAGRGNGGNTKPTRAYAKPEDVRAAYQAGKLSRQQAAQILTRDFGMK